MADVQTQIQTALEARARTALAGVEDSVVAAVRSAFAGCKELRAQAEPVLGLIETSKAKIERATTAIGQIDDALSRLEPFKDAIGVSPIYAVLNAAKPIIVAQVAGEEARVLLATLTLPAPSALAASVAVVAAKFVEEQTNVAIREFFKLIDNEI
jgi:hypothetical protein